MPGWPSWQLLTSAANLGKLPARDRGKQQRKSEQVSKWVPPASSRCILHSFSLQQALQLHRLDPVEWEPPTVSRGWGCPVHHAQLPAAPWLLGGAAWIPGRLQVRMRGNGGQKGQGALVLPLGLVWSHVSCRESRGGRDLSWSSELGAPFLTAFISSLPHSSRGWACPFYRGPGGSMRF